MSPHPLVWRLIVPFATMIVIVVGVCGAIVYWVGQETTRAQQIQDLERLVTIVRSSVPTDATSITPEQASRIQDLGDVLATRITLIDGNGIVLVDSYVREPTSMENHNTRPEVVAARERGMGSSVRRSDTIGENAVYFAQLLDPKKPDGVIVRLSYPERVWAHFGVPVWAIVVAGTVSAALIMAWLAWALQRQWVGPVRELADAADRMATGHWHTRVNPIGADAIQFLGNRFNVMAAHAEKTGRGSQSPAGRPSGVGRFASRSHPAERFAAADRGDQSTRGAPAPAHPAAGAGKKSGCGRQRGGDPGSARAGQSRLAPDGARDPVAARRAARHLPRDRHQRQGRRGPAGPAQTSAPWPPQSR